MNPGCFDPLGDCKEGFPQPINHTHHKAYKHNNCSQPQNIDIGELIRFKGYISHNRSGFFNPQFHIHQTPPFLI